MPNALGRINTQLMNSENHHSFSARNLRASGALLTLVLSLALASTAETYAKELIEFGWDEPDTAFLRAHISEMQQTPFDGCVFHASYDRTNGAKGSLTWEAWGRQAFTRADLAQAFADLRAVQEIQREFPALQHDAGED